MIPEAVITGWEIAQIGFISLFYLALVGRFEKIAAKIS
jgi:hypothetical protein